MAIVACHKWLLITWNVTSLIKELLISSNLNEHVWLVATVLEDSVGHFQSICAGVSNFWPLVQI